MAFYVQACDMDMYDIIMDSYFILKKKNAENKNVLKTKAKWTTKDKARVQVNFKSINIFHCLLNLVEFNRICTFEMLRKYGIN
ncbi:hypothetical protein REPUB_Repub08aG0123800 [Reevesia pubescens]